MPLGCQYESDRQVSAFVGRWPRTRRRPFALPDWLAQQVVSRDDNANSAITMIEQNLRSTVAFMNTSGLFRFDAHLDENILTDAERLYLSDVDPAISPRS